MFFPRHAISPGHYCGTGVVGWAERAAVSSRPARSLASCGPPTHTTACTCREFISPVLALALLVARALTSCGSSAVLTPEYHLEGRLAWGPLDYVVLYKGLALVAVVEVRVQGF